MTWEVGCLMALVFAWIGVLGVVAVDLSATMRKVYFAAVVAIFAVSLGSGCTREKIVYRDAPTGPSAPVTTPTPAPASLRFPQGIPENDIVIVPGVPTLYEIVNEEIAAMFPDCNRGDVRCDGHGYDPQSFFSVLNTRLRARGLWAGQHRDGQSDEITVAVSCTDQWQNFHAWAYEGYPLWANPISTPCAGEACRGKGTSYRGNTIIPASFCK